MKKIAILGGTGKEGKGLAYRWAKAGYEVVIGSRAEEKAIAAAVELNAMLGEDAVRAMINDAAAEWAELVVLTVPFAAHRQMCTAMKPYLAGKIVVDVTVPLVPPDRKSVV